MVNDLTYYYVTAPRDRPDYRTIKAFLWSDDRDCDSDGNAYPASSRIWTELMLEPRDVSGQRFDVVPYIITPLILKIVAETATIVAQVAYILAYATGGKVARVPEGPFANAQGFVATLEGFDLTAALVRFTNSPFARSTLNNVYPNLEI